MRTIPVLTSKEQANFWGKVSRAPGHGPEGTCWVWTGATVAGYGNIGITRKGMKTFLAHRVAYFLEYGEQPAQNCCHKCDNPPCVRPDHLFSGTYADNMADRDAKGRGGGDKRRGENNGRYTMPERTCRGDRWQQLHNKPKIVAKKRAAIKRFFQEHPGQRQGENNARSKLTEESVKEIRAAYSAGGTSSLKLAAKYEVSKQVILSVIHRRSWTHVE